MAPLPLLALTAALSATLPAAVPTAARPAALAPALSVPVVVSHSTTSQRHTVAAGETLFDLAQRYGTSVGALVAANSLSNPGMIYPGQTLTIPSGAGTSAAASPAAAGGGGSYTVRAGDTLSHIAAATGSSVAAIAAANGISPGAFIFPGQTLKIGGGATTSGTASASAGASGAAASTGPTAAAAKWANTMPSQSQTRDLIAATASAYGVDQRLAKAIGWQESGWNQAARSGAGAVGAMQVMPESGSWAGGLIGRSLDLSNPQDNVTAGVVILRQLGAMAKDQDEVIAAYYQGLGSVRENGWFADTRQYVANVKYFMTRL
ncbi:MAG: LysM peptidoglycan-binding domain-containing protein [Tetrasphaera sp.]